MFAPSPSTDGQGCFQSLRVCCTQHCPRPCEHVLLNAGCKVSFPTNGLLFSLGPCRSYGDSCFLDSSLYPELADVQWYGQEKAKPGTLV